MNTWVKHGKPRTQIANDDEMRTNLAKDADKIPEFPDGQLANYRSKFKRDHRDVLIWGFNEPARDPSNTLSATSP